jgi:hypothetical protein
MKQVDPIKIAHSAMMNGITYRQAEAALGQRPRKAGTYHASGAHFQAVRDFFAGQGNRWASIAEIATGTGLVRQRVRELIYVRNTEAFSRTGAHKRRRFRLRVMNPPEKNQLTSEVRNS